MSRYQPRNPINNPEKIVPENLVEQFFLTVRSADIDKIKEFATSHNLKYNLVEKNGKTPFHAILELDTKFASNRKKLSILQFLKQMGAPMDLPDENDVWPIHLAAGSQSKAIVDFFIDSGVNLNRKDSSNNTPLHYATNGKLIPCPTMPIATDLVSGLIPGKAPLNKAIESARLDLITLLSDTPLLSNDIYHVINTLNRIPQIYSNDQIKENLQSDIITAFTDAAADPTLSESEIVTSVETRLSQLNNGIYSIVSENLVPTLLSELNISPNLPGWGPTTLGSDPTSMERILENTLEELSDEMAKQYDWSKKTVFDISSTVPTEIPSLIATIDTFINRLVFCAECKTQTEVYAEDFTLIKILYLLIFNKYRVDYPKIFSQHLIENNHLMTKQIFDVVKDNGQVKPPIQNNSHILMFSTLNSIVDNLPLVLKNDYINRILLKQSDQSCLDYYLRTIFNGITTNAFDLSPILSSDIQKIIPPDLMLEYKDLPYTIVPGTSFFDILLDLIKKVGPTPKVQINDIFRDNNSYIIPRTPLPGSTTPSGKSLRYTYFHMMRVLHLIYEFIIKGDFQANDYPDIFEEDISDWEAYIIDQEDEIVLKTGKTITQTYPEFIFLNKLIAALATNSIKAGIQMCLNKIIDQAQIDDSFLPEEDPLASPPIMHTTSEQLDRNIVELSSLSDLNLFNLLLPSNPDPSEFDIFNKEDWYTIKKKTRWNLSYGLVQWFESFSNNIDQTFLEDTGSLTFSDQFFNIDKTNHIITNYDGIRSLVESNYLVNQPLVDKIISDGNFRSEIAKYLGIVNSSSNAYIIEKFDDLTKTINLTYPTKIEIGQRNPLFFASDTYSNIFIQIKQLFISIEEDFRRVSRMIADIIICINYEIFYYIPQIILPAMVKQFLVMNNYINNLEPLLNDIISTRSQILLMDNINKLATDFSSNISTKLSGINSNLYTIIANHNTVIDFLNNHSAYQLIKDLNDTSKIMFFTQYLSPLSNMPPQPSHSRALQALRSYSIPLITYHDKSIRQDYLWINLFDFIPLGTIPPQYNSVSYLSFIEFDRTGIVSNSPISGSNSQLNLLPDLSQSVVSAIPGIWLEHLEESGIEITYKDAFIGWDSTPFDVPWQSGMPPSIRPFIDQHLSQIKQRIIQNTIQLVKDTKPDLLKLETPTHIERDIIIGKVTNQILNQIFEFSLKQGVTNWIEQLSTNANSKQILPLIKNNNFFKVSLSEISSIDQSKLIPSKITSNYNLPQIQSPSSIPYSTHQSKFIHYLYNISNISSTQETPSNKQCYIVNPYIAEKLITPDNISAQNSDGNTPLHLAAQLANPELIKLYKKQPFLKNIHGQTPRDLITNSIRNHIEYVPSLTVESSIDNFVIPFNDLLLQRLFDEKFNNNIITGVELGIPIQLIMYNHQFYLFMQNYRYGYNFDLKMRIEQMFNKIGVSIKESYPMDLFVISENSLRKILTPAPYVSSSDTKKIRQNSIMMEELNNQISSLQKEKTIKTTDPQRIILIDEIIKQLTDKKNLIKPIIPKQTIVPPPSELFYASVKTIPSRITKLLNLTDFYSVGFGRIGNSKELRLAIWNNYLEKDLTMAPSMIFSQMYKIIGLLQMNFFNQPQDMQTVTEFFFLASEYINLKNSYPQDLDSNPLLEEEFKQIHLLINLILTPSMRNIILDQIYQGLSQMDQTMILTSDKTDVLNQIIKTEFNKITIDKFLEDILPKSSMKFFTRVYLNPMDTANSSDLFIPLMQIIRNIKIMPVSDDLISNFNDKIVPFMANTYNNFIFHLRLSIYSYDQFIINTNQLLQSLNSIE